MWSSAAACLCGFELLDNGKQRVRTVRDIDASMLKLGNPFCGMSGLICEREWLLANPFDETLPNGQDWDVYIRLAQYRPIAYVQQSLFRSLKQETPALRDRGVKSAPFLVLVTTDMPAILAEVACLSNASEAALLATGDYRQSIAEALRAGIDSYTATLSNSGSPVAAVPAPATAAARAVTGSAK